jgi:hypothetical protein
MVLFQVSDLDINKVWEISPYNAGAFGALLIVLGGIIYYLIKQLDKKDQIIKEKDDVIREINHKTHEFVDVISDKLNEIKHANINSKEKIEIFFEFIKEKLNKIS